MYMIPLYPPDNPISVHVYKEKFSILIRTIGFKLSIRPKIISLYNMFVFLKTVNILWLASLI